MFIKLTHGDGERLAPILIAAEQIATIIPEPSGSRITLVDGAIHFVAETPEQIVEKVDG